MNLKDVIENLSLLPEDGTVFAERINGEFRADSEAQVVEITDEELKQQTSEAATKKAPGKDYFLEVFIIQEVLEGWRKHHGGKTPPIDAALESVIYYAENDAYPESFFG
jgi:hypothetical protein